MMNNGIRASETPRKIKNLWEVPAGASVFNRPGRILASGARIGYIASPSRLDCSDARPRPPAGSGGHMSARGAPGCGNARRGKGFAFVELLVVMAILSAMAALLVPALTTARAQSQAIVCQSNVRQLLGALNAYAMAYGDYPPNFSRPAPAVCWYDQDRLGAYVSCTLATNRSLVGGIMACPADEGGQRSYAMNFWASSLVDNTMKPRIGIAGTMWSVRSPGAPTLILIAEKWGSAKLAGEWVTTEPFGFAGDTPGQRFGANGGIGPVGMHGSMVNCELPFARHRTRESGGDGTQPIGRVTIGYADGHVEMKSNQELVDPVSGLSTLDSLWSPLDASINH
jgi:prepilin-type N-terminal cleavage/methylation domain-containing protein/prepilin-type processing-associated H-X9-DG protein